MGRGRDWIEQLNAAIEGFQNSRQLHEEVRVRVRFVDGFETNVRTAIVAEDEDSVILVPAPPLEPGQDMEDAFVLLRDGRYLRSSWLIVNVGTILRVEIARVRDSEEAPEPEQERRVGFYVDHDESEA